MDDPALGFQADVAFAWAARFAFGHHLAVDRQRDVTLEAGDAVVVPLRAGFRAILGGKGAAAAPAVDRRHRRSVDGKDVAVRGEPVRIAVGVLQNLHLDASMKRLAGRRDVVGPDEHARVAFGPHMPPLQFKDEVLVHAVGAQLADRLARAH